MTLFGVTPYCPMLDIGVPKSVKEEDPDESGKIPALNFKSSKVKSAKLRFQNIVACTHRLGYKKCSPQKKSYDPSPDLFPTQE